MSVNPHLIEYARQNAAAYQTALTAAGKQAAMAKGAVVPMSAGGAGQPPMDPAMMGGAPPMGGDPSMDPAMMGGAPPMTGPSPLDPGLVQQIAAAVAPMLGGGSGGAAKGKKATLDVEKLEASIWKILQTVTQIHGLLGGSPSPEMVVGPPPDTQAMADLEQSLGGQPSMDPAMMGGAPPVDPSMLGQPIPSGGMAGQPPMDPAMMSGQPGVKMSEFNGDFDSAILNILMLDQVSPKQAAPVEPRKAVTGFRKLRV